MARTKKQQLKDYQREKFYNWERKNIPNGRHVPFDEIEAYVAKIWAGEGREYPPLVRPLNKNAVNLLADACRSKLRFQQGGVDEATIIHEVAHALTCNVDDTGDWHGPDFVGVLMYLNFKYRNIPLFALWVSADKVELDYARKLK